MLINNYGMLKELGIKDKGPCTAMAWANVFRCSPVDAREYLYNFGYRRGRGGMTTEQVIEALSSVKKSTVVRGPYTKQNQIRLQDFIELHPEGRYYVLVRGHALAIVDGIVYDHKEGLRRIVTDAFRVYVGKEGGYKERK